MYFRRRPKWQQYATDTTKEHFRYLFYMRCIDCFCVYCLAIREHTMYLHCNIEFNSNAYTIQFLIILYCIVLGSERLHGRIFASQHASSHPHQLVYQFRRFVYLNASAVAFWSAAAIACVVTCALGLNSLTFDGIYSPLAFVKLEIGFVAYVCALHTNHANIL